LVADRSVEAMQDIRRSPIHLIARFVDHSFLAVAVPFFTLDRAGDVEKQVFTKASAKARV